MVTVSPPVSPRVVARILITQKPRVTAGTLLSRSVPVDLAAVVKRGLLARAALAITQCAGFEPPSRRRSLYSAAHRANVPQRSGRRPMTRANSRDRQLRDRAEAVIPGGMYGHQATALLPEDYPQFFERGEGAHIWDVDGAGYLDFMCAYGPNLFGYANPQVDAAYVRQLGLGDTLTGPTALMVEMAEAMVAMVSHADWAMFCKNGTDATSMALTVARAHTRRKTVIRAKGAYHGAAAWCTPRPAGVIETDRAHQLFCDYNDVGSLESAAAQAGEDLACIF